MAVVDLGFLPEQAQEDALHAERLLAVEERPFQRVTKRILGEKRFSSISNLVDGESEGEDGAYDTLKAEKFRHEVLVDFASLESSLIRIQLILSSNQRERERYAAEKAKILETAQAVRDNTVELRVQLAEAQRIREQRKGYDEQAAKILDDRKLKSRDQTRADIEKLEKDIQDLQEESAEYDGTWVSRKEQFDNIVREGDAMIRLIKGIKDEPEPEPEKDENMEDTEEDVKNETSRFNSPAPDERSPRPTDAGDATPLPESGEAEGATPRPTNKFLDVDDATRSNSRISSPLVQPTPMQDDVDMGDAITTYSNPAESQEQTKISHSMDATDDQISTPQASTPVPDIAMDEA